MNSSVFFIWLSLAIPFALFTFCNVYAQQEQPTNGGGSGSSDGKGIIFSDPKLKIELVASGLDFPTTLAFLEPDDFLILERSGQVKRITNGKLLDKPLLEVDVSVKDERGLLGIAISEKKKPDANNGTSSIKNNNILITFFCIMSYARRKIQAVRTEYIDTIWIIKIMF